MIIRQFENGPFSVNSFLVYKDTSKKAIIVDPGHDLSALFKTIESESLEITSIVCTHGHIDHVSGVSLAKQRFTSSTVCHIVA